MKIDLNVLSEKQTESTVNETKMRLSENAASMVFQMFTKNIYSNPIGTIVREITSNCFDSHIEAGVKAPVLIKKSYDEQTTTHYISFIDYGMGISPNRMHNIYAVYFESTKRSDNQQIGGFGIGAKSVLAYKRSTGHGQGEYDNSFYVITISDKVKYYYCIYEGSESPVISLLHSEPTEEHNGTEVRIPVLEKDLSTFAKEMVRQLYYFENIIFEGFEGGSYGDILSNEYTIVRAKNFLFRGDNYSSLMHVCLGRVAYPIDYHVLGLNSNDYYLPVALRLEVGDINVVASREQLDYNEQTIKVLQKKLEEAKQEIIEMVSKQYENIVTLLDYFKFQNDFGTLYFPNNMTINIGSLIKKKDVNLENFKYGFMSMPTDKQLFKFFFEGKRFGKKEYYGRYCSKSNDGFDGGYNEIISKHNLLYIEGEFNRKVAKQSYLKDEYKTYYVISKRDVKSPFMRHQISELFNVHLDKIVDDNGKPVDFVQSLIEMRDEFWNIIVNYSQNYDNLIVPDEYLIRKKHNVLSQEVRNTEIPVKMFGSYYKQRVKLDELFKLKIPIFYGLQEDEYKLTDAHLLFKALFNSNIIINHYDSYRHKFDMNNSKKGIMFIMIAKNNLKYMQYCHNAVHVNNFYHKMLYRKADVVHTYFQTYKLFEKYDTLNKFYTNKNFGILNDKWGKVINKVNDYMVTLPQRNSTIEYRINELKRYFKIDNLSMSEEQRKIAKEIDKIKELEKDNTKILEYINTWNYNLHDSTYVEILKKVMIF